MCVVKKSLTDEREKRDKKKFRSHRRANFDTKWISSIYFTRSAIATDTRARRNFRNSKVARGNTREFFTRMKWNFEATKKIFLFLLVQSDQQNERKELFFTLNFCWLWNLVAQNYLGTLFLELTITKWNLHCLFILKTVSISI